jgi:hypothetical protein
MSFVFVLPLIYTNNQNRSNFCCPSKKDRKISIFPSDFVQSDQILAVRVNRGQKMLIHCCIMLKDLFTRQISEADFTLG